MHRDKYYEKVKLPRDAGLHRGSDIEWWYCYSFLNGEHGNRYAAIISFFKAGIIPFNKGCYLLFSLVDPERKTRRDFSLLDRKLVFNMNLILFPLFLHYIPDSEEIRRIYGEYKKYIVSPPHILVDRSSFKKNPVCIYCGKSFLKYVDEETGTFEVHVNGDDADIELLFSPLKPPAFIGEDGKPNQLYYYSYTDNQVTGRIIHKGSSESVTGRGWFDHQWGNARGLLTRTGWNWFGIQLDDNRELMVTELGSLYTGEVFSPSANLIEKDGSVKVTDNVTMEPTAFWQSPLTGAYYPLEWDILIPGFSIYLKVYPDFPEQEIPSPFPLQAIWEGTCTVSGYEDVNQISFAQKAGLDNKTGFPSEKVGFINNTPSKPLSGRCFMELVGYASF